MACGRRVTLDRGGRLRISLVRRRMLRTDFVRRADRARTEGAQWADCLLALREKTFSDSLLFLCHPIYDNHVLAPFLSRDPGRPGSRPKAARGGTARMSIGSRPGVRGPSRRVGPPPPSPGVSAQSSPPGSRALLSRTFCTPGFPRSLPIVRGPNRNTVTSPCHCGERRLQG